jgi:ligand-binding SRPBCC domain-containing protein
MPQKNIIEVNCCEVYFYERAFMKIHRLYRRQTLALDLTQAWQFFSSPYYLNQITPDFFHVDITSPVPDEIYAGLMISYQMKAVFGVPMSWLSEISHCEKLKRFVYQQREGPFKFWSHEVCLTEIKGGVVVEDIMFYTMPLGWFGEWMHSLFIGQRLVNIFETRRVYLQAKWGLEGESG